MRKILPNHNIGPLYAKLYVPWNCVSVGGRFLCSQSCRWNQSNKKCDLIFLPANHFFVVKVCITVASLSPPTAAPPTDLTKDNKAPFTETKKSFFFHLNLHRTKFTAKLGGNRGCQIVYCQTKNPHFGKTLEGLEIENVVIGPFGIFFDHLV
jgi:hypothetical protein